MCCGRCIARHIFISYFSHGRSHSATSTARRKGATRARRKDERSPRGSRHTAQIACSPDLNTSQVARAGKQKTKTRARRHGWRANGQGAMRMARRRRTLHGAPYRMSVPGDGRAGGAAAAGVRCPLTGLVRRRGPGIDTPPAAAAAAAAGWPGIGLLEAGRKLVAPLDTDTPAAVEYHMLMSLAVSSEYITLMSLKSLFTCCAACCCCCCIWCCCWCCWCCCWWCCQPACWYACAGSLYEACCCAYCCEYAAAAAAACCALGAYP